MPQNFLRQNILFEASAVIAGHTVTTTLEPRLDLTIMFRDLIADDKQKKKMNHAARPVQFEVLLRLPLSMSAWCTRALQQE